MGQHLHIEWQQTADQRGVKALAYFEEGTPEIVIEGAMEVLGEDNVVVFTR